MWWFWIDCRRALHAANVLHDGVAVWWMITRGTGCLSAVLATGCLAFHCFLIVMRGQAAQKHDHPDLSSTSSSQSSFSFENILHRVSKKLCKIIFCQNFAKFRPIVKIFGINIAERTSFSEMYSFSTSPNLCQHTTVWNADVQNCYITL